MKMIRVAILVSVMGLWSTVSAMDVEYTLADGKLTVSDSVAGRLSRLMQVWGHNFPAVSSETFKDIIAGLDTLERDPGAFFKDENKKRSVAQCEALVKAAIDMKIPDLVYVAFIKVTSEKGYAAAANDIIRFINPIRDLYKLDSNEDTALIRASKAGLADVVKCILKANANGINIKGAQKRTALHWAVEMGHEKIVSLLLKHHASVDEGDAQHKTPLHLAASKGFIQIAKLLLKHGARGNTYSSAATNKPLHEAAIAGHAEMVKLLVNAPHAYVNCTGIEDRTPLAEACINGRTNVVKALLQLCRTSGLDLDGKSRHKAHSNTGSYTPIEWAVFMGHVNLVKAYIEFFDEDRSGRGRPQLPLGLAAEVGNTEIVALLLDAGEDVNGDSLTPLMRASREGHLNVVKQLLAAKPHIDKMDLGGSQTALIHASNNGRVDVVRVLLRAGANVHHQDVNGSTALFHASAEGHTDVAKLLLQWGARVDYQNDEGLTALMVATENGHKDMVALLLSWYARTDLADVNANTALIIAKNGTKKDIEELVLKGPSKRWVTFVKKAIVAGAVTFVGYKAYEKYIKNYKVQDGPAVEAGPLAA